ncbi:LysR family transcriptional regulator ArgP [Tropicibacter naphthalenivorans]|uniref:Putative HTH-type transcriptional regulatorc/MT2039 n=1 Tax=Tropicibacter naphthalenivorans TaxID=441103 RepID=A0A0P1G315_9RHOB|nr:LysR family transcriptional regulator ArgP [Tropicibacter naphthalenivorans]CUH76182.1 putative HTH-type transcriptional regulatorc/MT2039 [Tropicibacter naphthalenivorans]SMC39484.1 LysR family transcriptional regulator, chromosome initiation inhibitor [Tropicibacter naphthalenivorans]
MRYDPAQLAALEAVLRLGAFDLAAAELGVTPSAISQRIRALEDRTGAPLILRGPPATPTATGARLARHAQELALLDAALARDLGETTQTHLRVAINADSLDTWAIPALARTSYLFDIVVEDESVSDQRLRSGDVVAAITSRDTPVQGCDVIPLGQLPYVATCSPDFHARHFADGVTPEALKTAPMLDFSGKDVLQRTWLRAVTGQTLAPPTHHLPSTLGFVLASLAGLGWGLNPRPMVDRHLSSGALIAMRPDHTHSVPLYWQVRSLMAPALRPLTRALRRAARDSLR